MAGYMDKRNQRQMDCEADPSNQDMATFFVLTQFLSGHGLFYAYLHKTGKVRSPKCPNCQENQDDDAFHTFFECMRWTGVRNCLREKLHLAAKDTTPEAVKGKMLESEKNWTTVADYVEKIMNKKILQEAAKGNHGPAPSRELRRHPGLSLK
ncbi:hypothetical protein GE061_019814 [Apolygus lucorum]|uniref:Reverse transcriptase zinc-binding domain-containing protein n=1 Tax=Apolygus lucorum TaxID=248454 RepID=A0A6A4JYH9_APOLU|nr:hypothetical protein GE061_019814 [Apolygus lucorum]